MRIAIDFDNTLTADPLLWLRFIESARTLRHEVVCVTSRRDTEENNEDVDTWMYEHKIDLPVYFTSLASKVGHMTKIGLPVDIWIDDDPLSCARGH